MFNGNYKCQYNNPRKNMKSTVALKFIGLSRCLETTL